MPNEYESMARILMSSPQGAKIVKGLDKLNSTASSPAGKQLMQLLAGGGTDLVKTACETAAKIQGHLSTLCPSFLGLLLEDEVLVVVKAHQ